MGIRHMVYYIFVNIQKIIIHNFRSIDDVGIELSEFGKINLFIGKNNCGKSNILRFIQLLGNRTLVSQMNNASLNGEYTINPPFLSIDDHNGYQITKPIKFSISAQVTEDFIERSLGLIPTDDFYVTYELRQNQDSLCLIKQTSSFINDLPEETIRLFESTHASRFGGSSGGTIGDARNRVSNLLKVSNQIGFPAVVHMDEFRKARENKELKAKLNEIVNPDYTNQANILKKELLCKYFKEVFGFEVDIKIPSLEKEIELVIDKKQIPLHSLGAGLQQVVLIAFTIVTSDAEIICIDEPELHIHPAAQRELLSLISKIEDKIFFLATHSNHFLDYEVKNKKVFQLVKEDGATKITPNAKTNSYREVLDDLGIRASEIYQTNGVLWVEGPSDRIYIKKWIELLSPELEEGLQYTFQYYGGKILSHYSVDDLEFKEYLNVLNLNRNAYVVMDSDMSKKFSIQDLRDTKRRIITECEKNKIGYWITEGKEMESYLTDRLLTEYAKTKINRDIYAPIQDYCPSYNNDTKVLFSRKISTALTLDDISNNLDLHAKITEIIDHIIIWNK